MAMHGDAFFVAVDASRCVSFSGWVNPFRGEANMSKHGNVVILESSGANQDADGETEALALLTERQVAELLGVRPHTLAVWRSTRKVPLLYVKVGKAVRYRRRDVEAFLQAAAERCADEFLFGRCAS